MDTSRLSDPLAWLSATTAAIVAWIAYQQHRATRAKLRLDLYDRRFRAYDGLQGLLAAVLREGDVTVDQIFRFGSQVADAAFLFDQDVVDYLDKIRKEAVRLRSLNSKLHEQDLPVGPERSQAAEENRRLLEWFTSQFEESKALFGRYLAFRQAY